MIALVASIVVHLGAGGVLIAIDAGAEPFGSAGEGALDAIEFEVAPAPLEPFDPGDETEDSEPPTPSEPEEPEEQTVAITDQLPEPELDLGPAEADAGIPDAQAVAATDSDARHDRDAGSTLAADSPDAGPATASAALDAGTSVDGGTRVASGEDAADGRPIPPGADADFRAYTPKGEVLGVLIRFDRLRDSQWAARVDKVLAPMPDYRMIIGQRKVPLTDLFDMLLISSNEPSDVTATNLAGYTPKRQGSAMREFLNHREAPVRWTVARGGALGKRGKSKLSQAGDSRVYLMPFSSWTVLTERAHLGKLTQPSGGDLDSFPSESVLPKWLANIRNVGDESGTESEGPVVVASLYGGAATLKIPMVGDIPTPERLSVAIEIATIGFRVQGTLSFSSEDRAKQFESMVTEGKARMVETAVGKRILKQFHALNAAQGLTLTRRGNRMSFVSSFSIADAIAMLERAAELSERYYSKHRQ